MWRSCVECAVDQLSKLNVSRKFQHIRSSPSPALFRRKTVIIMYFEMEVHSSDVRLIVSSFFAWNSLITNASFIDNSATPFANPLKFARVNFPARNSNSFHCYSCRFSQIYSGSDKCNLMCSAVRIACTNGDGQGDRVPQRYGRGDRDSSARFAVVKLVRVLARESRNNHFLSLRR